MDTPRRPARYALLLIWDTTLSQAPAQIISQRTTPGLVPRRREHHNVEGGWVVGVAAVWCRG